MILSMRPDQCVHWWTWFHQITKIFLKVKLLTKLIFLCEINIQQVLKFHSQISVTDGIIIVLLFIKFVHNSVTNNSICRNRIGFQHEPWKIEYLPTSVIGQPGHCYTVCGAIYHYGSHNKLHSYTKTPGKVPWMKTFQLLKVLLLPLLTRTGKGLY